MNGKSIGTIYSEVDLNHMQPLTPDQQTQLDNLRTMRDEDIDTSDTPVLHGEATRFGPGRLGNSVLLAPDVREFFEVDSVVDGERVNAALRKYIEQHRQAA